jgi:hypothetical protein
MLFFDCLRRRLVRQAPRFVGLGVMLLAAGVSLARADVPLTQTTTVEFTPTPAPTPAPAPRPGPNGYIVQRGGPIHFGFTGSLTMGTQLRSQSYQTGGFPPVTGISPSPSPTASTFPFQVTSQSQNLSQGGAAVQAEVSRRTAMTFTDVRFPFGFSTGGGSQFGTSVQALYSTPKFSIGYLSQPLMLFGQLPLGATLRGFTFILPQSRGQTTFYEGPTIGANGETVRLQGAIAQQAFGQTFFEEGYTMGSGPETGRSNTVELGAATTRGDFSAVGETAWQSRNCAGLYNNPALQAGCDGTPDGAAFQVRFDNTLPSSGLGLTLRLVPDRFVAFGSGEIHGDEFADLNYHVGTAQSVLLDANYERTGDGVTGITTQYLENVSIGGTSRIGGYLLGIQQQNLTSFVDGLVEKQDTSVVQTQLATQLGSSQMLFGAQFGRSIQDGVPQSTITYNFNFGHQFSTFGLTAYGQSQRQTIDGTGPTTQVGESLAFNKQFGRAMIQLGDTIQHSVSPFSDAIQTTPLVTIARQISPALTVEASLGLQRTTDKINPAANGHSRIFTIQLSAPFEYGNEITTGRVDPRLPATIAGHVQIAQTTSPTGMSFAALSPLAGGGVPNVEVILDDRYVQRTDLTGGFQFAFIAPGQHQLRVENSTLPRGTTVSVPVATLVVQGGQVANVLFDVGSFGGVIGHVTGMDASGNKVALPNVQLRLDDGAYSQTDTTGAYGFGGLSAGSHTVEVIENSVPAFATFDPAQLKKKVDVSNGSYATLDFGAQPLGSIAGKILYAPDVATENLSGGVPNAYVVAEPGEHAAIDDDDGSFIIDNLPPGDYTVSVDPETLQEGLGGSPESISIHLDPGQHYEGALFRVGRFEKKVVFSLLSGVSKASLPTVHLAERKLPPQGTSEVTVSAPAEAGSVTITIFGQPLQLKYDKRRKLWAGEIEVPKDAKAGDYQVAPALGSGTAPSPATLTVDPTMPLAILTMTPPNSAVGANVTVRARFLVDAKPGDRIEWEDGTVTVLGKPISGRVFTFPLHLSLRPLHGSLLTAGSRLPIVLM